MKEYKVKRSKGTMLEIYDPYGYYLGSVRGVRAAKKKIKEHKEGRGPGTVVYRETA